MLIKLGEYVKNTFYRFKYMRRNIISIPIILFILFLMVNVIAFTRLILVLSLTTFLITIYFFIKYGIPIIQTKIIIHQSGIEWIFKKKLKAIFRWEEIIDIVEIRSSMITSFDLILSDKTQLKVNLSTFRFDYNKEILDVMKSYCTNTNLLSKMKDYNPKY